MDSDSGDRSFEAYEVKPFMEEIVNTHFGAIGSAEPVDILGMEEGNQVYIRVHRSAYTFLLSAVCMVHKYEGANCSIEVVKCSPFCGSLSTPSRFLDLSTFQVLE